QRLAGELAAARPMQSVDHLELEISIRGRALDISTTTDAAVPIVSQQAAHVLQQSAGGDIQLLPARIQGVGQPFYYVNVLRLIDCMDRNRSTISGRWGKGEILIEPAIDSSRAGAAGIFRVTPQVIVVRDSLRQAIEDARLIGPRFIPLKMS